MSIKSMVDERVKNIEKIEEDFICQFAEEQIDSDELARRIGITHRLINFYNSHYFKTIVGPKIRDNMIKKFIKT